MECRSLAESDNIVSALLTDMIEGDTVYVYKRESGREKIVKQITVDEDKFYIWKSRIS